MKNCRTQKKGPYVTVGEHKKDRIRGLTEEQIEQFLATINSIRKRMNCKGKLPS